MLDIKKIEIPQTLGEALELMSREALEPMAGGTDLIVDLRNKVLEDKSLIALGSIPELKGIRLEGEDLFIGPTTTFSQIIASELINDLVPVLAQAALTVAGPQIRNVATIGGNVAKGAVSADSIPSLLVYDAVATVQSKAATRQIPLKDLFTGPGKTDLAHDELLTAITIKGEDLSELSAHYIKYSVRKSMDLAVLGVAMALSLKDGVIDRLRVALGVAAPTPLRLLADEDFRGRTPDETLIADVIAAVESSTKLRDSWRASKEYREHLLKVLLRDAFQACLKQAKEKDHA